MKFLNWQIAFLVFLTIQGCLFDSSPSKISLPPEFPGEIYVLRANDGAKSDSISQFADQGILMQVQKGGNYDFYLKTENNEKLAAINFYPVHVDGDSGFYIGNLPIAQIYGSSDGDSIQRFSFSSAGDYSELALRVVNKNGNEYPEKITEFYAEGEGSRSLTLNFNLIQVGLLKGMATRDSFAMFRDTLQSVLKMVYEKAGISIGKINLLYASENPLTGDLFPDDKPYYFPIEGGMLDTLSYWNDAGVENALDVLICSAIDEDGFLGLSPLPGKTMRSGRGSTVILGVQNRSLGTYVPVPMHEIALTAAHEIGHFLGLRHTTSTQRDLELEGDASVVEDGLSDTPFCDPSVLNSIFNGGTFVSYSAMVRPRVMATQSSEECPDRDNLMFPVSDDEINQTKLSAMQARELQMNLSLFP